MSEVYNVYCDESCHLEHDHKEVMVLGAVWCPTSKHKEIASEILKIKIRNHANSKFEAKWTKVSQGNLSLYIDLLNYFFDNNDLHFRAVIIPEKSKLKHNLFNQTHDTWYHKMYFTMLKVIFKPGDSYRIFLDIKDTHSAQKISKLEEVLRNNAYDYSRDIIQLVQPIKSNEMEQMQLVDLLVGAIGYKNRNLTTSASKLQLVELIKRRSYYSLTRSTLLREDKVNLLVWQAWSED